jgi:hypothetical protein
MNAFITKTDLDRYKYVADSIKNAIVWPQFVLEAQMLDVKPQIGDALMDEISTQIGTSPESLSVLNSKLLDGGTYTCNSKTYIFHGLRAAIIYFAFARFTSRSPYNYTAAGITVKDTDFSTPASDKAVQRLQTESYLTAQSIIEETKLYLYRNKSDYPLYACPGSSGRPRTFFVIGD